MEKIRQILVLLSAFLILPTNAQPADFTYKCDTDSCRIQLKGDIEEGDLEKLLGVLTEIKGRGLPVSALHLLSQGGNVAEAVRIGRLVRAYFIFTYFPMRATSDSEGGILLLSAPNQDDARKAYEISRSTFSVIAFGGQKISSSKQYVDIMQSMGMSISFDADAMCASACALIAVSGLFRCCGEVGLHHIYVENKSIDFSDLNSILSSGNSEISSFLAEMRAPSAFLDIMVSTPSKEMEWFNLPRYDPIFREYVDSRCPGLTDDERSDNLNLWLLQRNGQYRDETGKLIRRQISSAELRYLAQLEARSESASKCTNELYISARWKAQGLE